MLRGSVGLSAALAAVVASLALSAPAVADVAPLPLTARGGPGFAGILILGLIVAALIVAVVLWRRRR